MKIAISSNGNDLNSQIDPRFGRCAYFLIVDPENMSFEAFDNESVALGGGAGIQAARFVSSKGAGTVITGNCGPNAMRTLSAAGVDVVVGASGPVKDAMEAWKRDELKPVKEPSVSSHYGMRGGGRGAGRGKGQMAQNAGAASRSPSGSGSLPAEENLTRLKEQVDALREQLDGILSDIKKLKKA